MVDYRDHEYSEVLAAATPTNGELILSGAAIRPPEISEVHGLELILPQVVTVEFKMPNTDGWAEIRQTDFDVVANLLDGGEPQVVGVADYFRDRWHRHMLETGTSYEESVEMSGRYAIGMHKHLHGAIQAGTLRLPQMDDEVYVTHVKQVAAMAERIRTVTNG